MSTATLYAVSHVTGNASSPNNALGAPDDVWTADGNTGLSWVSRWRLDTVSGAVPSGTQTITLRVRKGTNIGNPVVASVSVWQSGTQLATISSGSVSVSSTTGANIVYTFDGSILSGAADVDIQVSVTRSSSFTILNSVELDAITWDIDFLPTAEVDIAATEAADTADVSVVEFTPASFAVTETADFFAGHIATEFGPAFEGDAFTEAAFYATSAFREADLAVTETADTTAVALEARHEVALAVTEIADTTAVALEARHDISFGLAETADTTAVALAARHEVALAATETADTTAVALAARHDISFGLAETADTTAVALAARHEVALAVTETADTTAVALAARHEVALAATETADTAAVSAIVLDGAVLDATETPDTTATAVSVYWFADLAATEAQDVSAFGAVRNVPLDAGAGALTLAGNPADLLASRFLYPETGQMVFFGFPNELVYFRVFPVGAGQISITGYPARLYQSSFFYNDYEVVFAPEEMRVITVSAPASQSDPVIYAGWENRFATAGAESRMVLVPPDLTVDAMSENRSADGEPRLRAL
jgi:hypothetical protein